MARINDITLQKDESFSANKAFLAIRRLRIGIMGERVKKFCDVSIIVPVFNGENYIDHLIQNFRMQTYKDFEVIFVDDGSTDSTAQKLDAIESKTLPFDITVIHQKNSGVSAARNKGLLNASGEYVCFIDADDVISQDYLMVLRRSFYSPDVNVVMGYITRNARKLESHHSTAVQIFDKTPFCGNFFIGEFAFQFVLQCFLKNV